MRSTQELRRRGGALASLATVVAVLAIASPAAADAAPAPAEKALALALAEKALALALAEAAEKAKTATEAAAAAEKAAAEKAAAKKAEAVAAVTEAAATAATAATAAVAKAALVALVAAAAAAEAEAAKAKAATAKATAVAVATEAAAAAAEKAAAAAEKAEKAAAFAAFAASEAAAEAKAALAKAALANELANALREEKAAEGAQDPLDCEKEIVTRRFPLGDSPVFCVDAMPDNQLRMAGLPEGKLVIRPNETIYVVVRTWDDHVAKVTMGGNVGLSVPALNDTTKSPRGDAGTQNVNDATQRKQRTTVWAFAPRKTADSVTVTVELVKKDSNATVGTLTFDFVVETVYYGALRLGIALGFGQFDRGYTSQQVGDSSVFEVVSAARTAMNMELVLAFAPYLDGIFSGNLHGRSYANGSSRIGAPYFGIGVLSQANNNNLEAFRSFHIGGEIELGKNFSIALTYVGRFVKGLPAGVAVGSPAPDGTLATQMKMVSGGAVVFNLTPEFFKIAAGGAK